MRREKHDQIQREDDWMALANAKGYACEQCGARPEYDEREIFFEAGTCARCEHVMSKDD